MNARQFKRSMRTLGASLPVIAVLSAGLGAALVAGYDATQKTPETQCGKRIQNQ